MKMESTEQVSEPEPEQVSEQDSELDLYIQYLNSKPVSNYQPILKFCNEYETYIRYHHKKGLCIDELFLKCIRDNNFIMFRKMIVDPRVNPSFQNNEALVMCVLYNQYTMLSLLLQHPYVSACDQNNLPLRIAISKKDKMSLDILLKNQSVLEHIYNEPDLLSYVWVYQNNGNVIL